MPLASFLPSQTSHSTGSWLCPNRKTTLLFLIDDKNRIRIPKFQDAVKDGNWQKEKKEEKKEEVRKGDDRVKNGAAAQPGKSYLQIVRGEKSKSEPNKEVEVCLKAEPAGNGWLHRSAVAILDRLVSMADLRVSFMNEIRQNVVIRAMGGRSVLITFASSEIRDDIIQTKVMQRWFVSVSPWKNEAASLERFVWLSCSGMPLNAWNDKNFKLIGELWGQYIQADDKTLRDEYFAKGRILISTFEASKIDSWIMLDVDNMLYRVHVEEDDRFISPEDWSIDLLKVKSFEIPISDSSSDEEDDDDGDNNEDEDSRTDKLNGNDDNMEENKGKESNGILEDEATSAILGTTINQHNQHGDNTIKEGGGVGQKQLPLTQEDGKSMEEKTKSPVQLGKDVSRVVDSMGLGAYHDDGPDTNEAISNLAQQIKKADGLDSVGQIILDPKLVQVEIQENEGHLNNVDRVIDGGGEQRSLIQSIRAHLVYCNGMDVGGGIGVLFGWN
ncbi:hypothetical protein RHSIM_Rhsim04G0141400 [Rhododendron simsii]|uniref:DUF4283 domain-containing protein n=1 Tax=Rhododendron simsii TaxID=118357 RepID=A0A834LPY0_RHOSS|nr:hypothetical protein RHSIM_Rhsim04G0141400 [Rhododendron simsii]